MIMKLNYIIQKFIARKTINDAMKELRRSYPYLNIEKSVSSYDMDRDVQNRVTILFSAYGENDNIIVRGIHFSESGYAEDHLKKGVLVQNLIMEDVKAIHDFMNNPRVVGTKLPQFSHFTYHPEVV